MISRGMIPLKLASKNFRSFLIGLSSGTSSTINETDCNFRIPPAAIQKREKLRAVAARHGVDLRTAALQFSAAAPEAVALVVGARSGQQIQQDWNSMQAKIPAAFWDELKHEKLIEQAASTPAA